MTPARVSSTLRLSIAVPALVWLSGCVSFLPNGGGLEATMTQFKPPSNMYPVADLPGIEALSSNVFPPGIDAQKPLPDTAAGAAEQQPAESREALAVALLDAAETPVPQTTAAMPESQPEVRKPAPGLIQEKGKITVIPARPGRQHNSLWERLVDGFDLDDKSNQRGRAELEQFQRHPRSTRKLLNQGRTYLWEITEAVELRDLPRELALLPAIESRFNPMARSHRRALGLWQFMPGTADHLGLEQNWWFDARLDVTESTQAALDYLEYLYARFQDWQLALAAYNCGEARLQRAIDAAGGNTDFWALGLPEETRRYVPKLLALSVLVEDPDDYGLQLPDLPDQQTTDTVVFDRQVNLALAARHADIDLNTLQYLNPGLLRWATPPNGPHRLRVPAGKSKQLQASMPDVPAPRWADWQTYLVREGDSLSEIAQRFGIQTADLKSINGLKGNLIRSGQSLMLPGSVYLASAGNARSAQGTVPEDAVRIEYLVKSGDTLWEIARNFSVSIEALSSWNGLHAGSILRPGKKLVVWVNNAQQIPAEQLAKG